MNFFEGLQGMWLYVVLALGLVLIALGFALWSLPAGVIVFGIEIVAGALLVDREDSRASH